MKRVLTFFLTAIYLVFITGPLWTAESPVSYAYENTFGIVDKTVGNISEKTDTDSFSKSLSDLHFHKVFKHLAAGGKTKVPRASYTPAAFTNFISHLSLHHHYSVFKTVGPEPSPHPIFLKNCVLRI